MHRATPATRHATRQISKRRNTLFASCKTTRRDATWRTAAGVNDPKPRIQFSSRRGNRPKFARHCTNSRPLVALARLNFRELIAVLLGSREISFNGGYKFAFEGRIRFIRVICSKWDTIFWNGDVGPRLNFNRVEFILYLSVFIFLFIYPLEPSSLYFFSWSNTRNKLEDLYRKRARDFIDVYTPLFFNIFQSTFKNFHSISNILSSIELSSTISNHESLETNNKHLHKPSSSQRRASN